MLARNKVRSAAHAVQRCHTALWSGASTCGSASRCSLSAKQARMVTNTAHISQARLSASSAIKRAPGGREHTVPSNNALRSDDSRARTWRVQHLDLTSRPTPDKSDEKDFSAPAGSPDVTNSLFEELRHSLDSASLHAALEIVAKARRNAGFERRAASLGEVLCFLSAGHDSLIHNILERRFSRSNSELFADLWTRWFNIATVSRTWSTSLDEIRELVMVLNTVSKGSKAPLFDERSVWSSVDLLPNYVLLSMLSRVSTAQQAELALQMLIHRIDSMPLAYAVKCFQALDFNLHRNVGAWHLSGTTTEVALSLAERALNISQEELAKLNDALSPNRHSAVPHVQHFSMPVQAAYDVVHDHLVKLMDGLSRTHEHAFRVVYWAQKNKKLGVEVADRLRMLLLRIQPKQEYADVCNEFGELLPWDQVRRWTFAPESSFANARMARILIRSLVSRGRVGVGLQMALERVMQIAKRHRDSRLVADVEHYRRTSWQGQSMTFEGGGASNSQEDFDGQFAQLLGTNHLQLVKGLELALGDGDEAAIKQAWVACRPDWHELVALAAENSRFPISSVVRLAGIDSKYLIKNSSTVSEGDATTRMVHCTNGFEARLNEPRVYAALLSKLPLRRTGEAFAATRMVWDVMQKQGSRPDSQCIGAYCQALIRSGCTEEAMQLLEEQTHPATTVHWQRQRNGRVVANWQLLKVVMVALSSEGQTKALYELLCDLQPRFGLQVHPRHLETLLRGACRVSKEIFKQGNVPTLLLSRFSAKGRLARERMQQEASWDGLPPAERARAIFRRLLFRQHPSLASLPSPFGKDGHSGSRFAWKQEMNMLRLEAWFTDRFELFGKPCRFHRSSLPDPALRNVSGHGEGVQQLVSFDAPLFHSYVELLQYVVYDVEEVGRKQKVNDETAHRIAWDERYVVLSWMRALDVLPMQKTLCLLFSNLHAIVPPAAQGAGGPTAAALAGPLYPFLVDWLGEDAIPSVQEHSKFVRSHSWAG